MLRRRVNVLERILQSTSVDVETAIAEFTANEEGQEEPGGMQQPNEAEDTAIATADEASPAVRHPQTNSPVSPDARNNQSGFRDVNDSSHTPTTSSLPGALSHDALLNFDADGEARYFGPTSGRLEFQQEEDGKANDEDGNPNSKAAANTPRALFNQFYQDVVDDNALPEALEERLINLYFTWEQPWCQVVDERLFRESRADKGPYFSPLLLNCILCVGSRYDVDSDPERPPDPDRGRLFLEKAEVLLHYDLKWPSISTLQALCILGTIYVAMGADAAGWLHQGMANRLALDMGLNLDCASLAEGKWLLRAEVELRRRIYWSLYIVDKLSACYTGRVCTFLDSQGVVELPSPSYEGVKGTQTVRHPHVATYQRAMVELCRCLEKTMLSLYAPKPLRGRKQRAIFVDSQLLALKNWQYDLPDVLRVDRGRHQKIPQVYTLHMMYHTAYIILMRPFLNTPGNNTKDNKPQTGDDRVSEADVERAKKVCYQAAGDICSIARKYRTAYGNFRQSPITATHCTLSAALILFNAKNLRWAGTHGVTIERDMKLCLQVLEELSVMWSPARHIWKNVAVLDALDKPKQQTQSPPQQQQQHRDQHQEQITELPVETTIEIAPNTLDATATAVIGGVVRDANLGIFLTETSFAFGSDYLPGDYENFDMLSRLHYDNIW
ncbi:hypothetical protein SBRCBS47491_004956 [Sporothrix bragantina]|uniref:Xylanolytic transcriptional activator regulatory domain-containing protein n=1 Tax=Sporothrix bragantina TaxID=671064 RepID=A0ABP0BT96_9PEZI